MPLHIYHDILRHTLAESNLNIHRIEYLKSHKCEVFFSPRICVRPYGIVRIEQLTIAQLINIQYNSTYPDAGYPEQLVPSGKRFLNVTVLHFLWLNFSPICQIHTRDYVQGILNKKTKIFLKRLYCSFYSNVSTVPFEVVPLYWRYTVPNGSSIVGMIPATHFL
jgi:hypothetical protein